MVDNVDPEQLGRLKLQVPSVLGREVVTGWAMPCVPYGGDVDQGFLFIPEVGVGVWVEFEEGDLEFPIWVGTFWSKPGGESELPKPNDPEGSEEDSVQDPPTRKIIKTKAGHTIQFEDAEGEEMVMIYEAGKEHVLTMDKNGIAITYGSDKQNKQKVILDEKGILIADKFENQIKMDATSGFPSGPGITVNSGKKRVCLDMLIDWLLQHQHVGNMGAPTPLFPANMRDLMAAKIGDPNGILSTKITVK